MSWLKTLSLDCVEYSIEDKNYTAFYTANIKGKLLSRSIDLYSL